MTAIYPNKSHKTSSLKVRPLESDPTRKTTLRLRINLETVLESTG